jgi:adenosylhomocysteine nucleosidase
MKKLQVLAVALAVLVVLAMLPGAALAQAPIGVLGITAEIAPIEKRLQDSREVDVHGYVFHTGKLDGRQVVVGRSGAGKVNAAIVATLLITNFNPTTIFFSGTAGAVDPALRPGDVVIGATVVQHDVGLQTASGVARHGPRNAVTGEMDPLSVPAPPALLTAARQSASGLTLPPIKAPDGTRVPKIVEGVIVTGDVFLSDAGRREELRTTLIAPASENAAALVEAIIGHLEPAR